MNLSDLQKYSDDQLNQKFEFNPTMPDGVESDLKLTIRSINNDDKTVDIFNLSRKYQKCNEQLQKAQGENIKALSVKRRSIGKQLALALLVDFKGLEDNGKQVACSDESKSMLVEYSWIAEEIISEASDRANFLGKSSNSTSKPSDTSQSESQTKTAKRS